MTPDGKKKFSARQQGKQGEVARKTITVKILVFPPARRTGKPPPAGRTASPSAAP
jgi:hypothetical protein